MIHFQSIESIFQKQRKKNKKKSIFQGGEMNQALYAHMNNKRKMKKKVYSFPNKLSYYFHLIKKIRVVRFGTYPNPV
jgi:hypothetical protein